MTKIKLSEEEKIQKRQERTWNNQQRLIQDKAVICLDKMTSISNKQIDYIFLLELSNAALHSSQRGEWLMRFYKNRVDICKDHVEFYTALACLGNAIIQYEGENDKIRLLYHNTPSIFSLAFTESPEMAKKYKEYLETITALLPLLEKFIEESESEYVVWTKKWDTGNEMEGKPFSPAAFIMSPQLVEKFENHAKSFSQSLLNLPTLESPEMKQKFDFYRYRYMLNKYAIMDTSPNPPIKISMQQLHELGIGI